MTRKQAKSLQHNQEIYVAFERIGSRGLWGIQLGRVGENEPSTTKSSKFRIFTKHLNTNIIVYATDLLPRDIHYNLTEAYIRFVERYKRVYEYQKSQNLDVVDRELRKYISRAREMIDFERQLAKERNLC